MDNTQNPKDITNNKVDWLESVDTSQPGIEETVGGGKIVPEKAGHSKMAEEQPTESGNTEDDTKAIEAIRSELLIMQHTDKLHVMDKATRWLRGIINNWAAAMRAKVNETVTDQEGVQESMFTKQVKRTERSKETVEGLKREYHFLQVLEDSGITPKPLMLKLSPDGYEGNLLMTKVPGVSLEQIANADEELPDNFSTIYTAIRKSLDQIHESGVAVVDINEGTFVIDGLEHSESSVKASVVDFEFAAGMKELESGKDVQYVTDMYSNDDIGYALAAKHGEGRLTREMIRKIEHGLAAKHLVQAFIGEEPCDLRLLPPEAMAAYDKQLARIEPELRELRAEEFAKQYENTFKHDPQLISVSKEEYIEDYLQLELPDDIATAMLNITAPYLLQDFGIEVKPEVLVQLQQDLSPFLEERAA